MTHTETNDTQLGLISLTEITPHPVTGATLSTRQRVEEIIAVAKLADAVGLDVFAVGEHHRSDYAISIPAMLLGALARETSRIRLTSGTSLIATADPVRLYQDFATVDLLSGGRAEIIVGRGRSPSPSPCSATASRTATPCSWTTSTCCCARTSRSA